MTDIVERLRAFPHPEREEAADEIARLRARLAEAEALLRETQMHLLYHGLARGLRELVDAFFVGDKP